MPSMKGFSTGTMASFRAAASKIAKAATAIGGNVGPVLRVIGEEIMTDVKDAKPGKGVPVDTGTLRSTGRVDGPTGDKEPYVTLSFGGASAPYALIQHEVLRFRHKIGEARYLVRGLERWRPDNSAGYALLKQQTDRALQGAGGVAMAPPARTPTDSGSSKKSTPKKPRK